MCINPFYVFELRKKTKNNKCVNKNSCVLQLWTTYSTSRTFLEIRWCLRKSKSISAIFFRFPWHRCSLIISVALIHSLNRWLDGVKRIVPIFIRFSFLICSTFFRFSFDLWPTFARLQIDRYKCTFNCRFTVVDIYLIFCRRNLRSIIGLSV